MGYIEGQNVLVEYRWADWNLDRGVLLAAELARLKVNVIVATPGATAVRAVQKATWTIPVVFTAGDAIGSGLVASLERPSGNVTGVNLLNFDVTAKRLELLKAMVPEISRVAVFVESGQRDRTRPERLGACGRDTRGEDSVSRSARSDSAR